MNGEHKWYQDRIDKLERELDHEKRAYNLLMQSEKVTSFRAPWGTEYSEEQIIQALREWEVNADPGWLTRNPND